MRGYASRDAPSRAAACIRTIAAATTIANNVSKKVTHNNKISNDKKQEKQRQTTHCKEIQQTAATTTKHNKRRKPQQKQHTHYKRYNEQQQQLQSTTNDENHNKTTTALPPWCPEVFPRRLGDVGGWGTRRALMSQEDTQWRWLLIEGRKWRGRGLGVRKTSRAEYVFLRVTRIGDGAKSSSELAWVSLWFSVGHVISLAVVLLY